MLLCELYNNEPYRIVDDATVSIQGKTFVKHRVERNDPLVVLRADVLEGMWRDSQMRIGHGPGYENQIGNRIANFKEWLSKNDGVIMPNVHVQENGSISFGDGRHRTRVLIELGFDHIPVTMSQEALRNLKVAAKNGRI